MIFGLSNWVYGGLERNELRGWEIGWRELRSLFWICGVWNNYWNLVGDIKFG